MRTSVIKRIVLLPGLDGTGALFADFVAALPPTVAATVIDYPKQEFYSYAELLELVRGSVADLESYVVLGESFSSPLAVHLAATRPKNLAGLIICAGFVSNPFPHAKFLMRILARPFLFRLPTPDFIHKYFVTGWSAPAAFIERIHTNLRLVSPEVLAGRVHEILNCDAREDMVRTTAPTMYLQGEYDRLIRRRCFEEIQQLQPRVRLASVAAPHLVLQMKPRESVEAILKFMGEITT
jgi:pimeloyl-[acyl-carrier protein] methyl ester esterase